MRTFVICEAGSNHGGDLNHAKRLIALAANVGAQACKFQFCSDYDELMKKRKLFNKPYPFSIPEEWLPELQATCTVHGTEFMCTTYLTRDIKMVARYVKRFKISNFESRDYEFIEAHSEYRQPVLISGNNLYCVSKYPCPDSELYLQRQSMGIGLSDHTKNPLTGALAVARGAMFIETHFRLNDTNPECPDYEVARTPQELVEYIKHIRQAEVLMYGQS